MKPVSLTGLVVLITLSTSATADELKDNDAYAIMQDCLAGAELSYNQKTGLDRYCIDSYLATTAQAQTVAD